MKVSSGLFIGLTRMAEELLEELEINPDILRENATKDYAASTTSRPTTTTVENTSSTLPPTTASTASTTITTTEKLGFWSLHTFRAYSLKMSRKCGFFEKCHDYEGFFSGCCPTLSLQTNGSAKLAQPHAFGLYDLFDIENNDLIVYRRRNPQPQQLYLFK